MGKFEQVEERIDEVKNDYGKIGVKDLENKYNASYSTIQRVLKKHGIIKGKLHQIKYKYINEHKDEFINDWIDGILTLEELSKKYQCPETEIFSFARERSIKRKTLIEKLNINDIINSWNLKTMLNCEICEKYNISNSMLLKILKENNIEDAGKRYGRKYFFNEKYFDMIDTEDKAYWLGFIYADGCHHKERYSLTITLKEEDEELLKNFYKCIECDKNIGKKYNKKYNKYYSEILIQHPHLSESLIKCGVMNDKSFKIKFPSNDIVPNNLKRHFIRGYFDGDGSISLPKNMTKINVSITSNYDFLKEMKDFIESDIKDFKMNINGENYTKIYRLRKSGALQVEKFLNWLYKDATIYMDRKYERYLKLLEYNKMKGHYNDNKN